MRKTSDLVNEMRPEAKGAWLVAIAVGFEKETKFVFSSQKQPLGELNQLVQKGGSPIGLLRFDKDSARYRDHSARSRNTQMRNGQKNTLPAFWTIRGRSSG